MRRDELIENAQIPLPKTSGLIKRSWKLENRRKKGLNGYQSEFISEANFNFGLAFYKYIPDTNLTELSERKKLWMKLLSKDLKFDENALPHRCIYKYLKFSDMEEGRKHIQGLLQMEVKVFDMKTVQPLIVGLGEASPYETGITLDYLTGLPIIPGSALKGITRRAAIMKLTEKTDILPYGEEFEELAKEVEEHPRKYPEYVKIFGTQEQKGKVIFMDAYPIEWSDGNLFRLDVMNPHYGPYYENPSKNPPADWYNPVPIFYLTVNEGVTYRFILASEDKSLLKDAGKWLNHALQNIGIGAKGNQGYGVFKNIKEVDHDQNTD